MLLAFSSLRRAAGDVRKGTISRAEHWNPYSLRSRLEAAMSLSVEAHAERRYSGTDISFVGGRFEVGKVIWDHAEWRNSPGSPKKLAMRP